MPKKNAKNLFGIDKLNEKRSVIPAVTHVDYSARVQTVDSNYNKKFYGILKEFEKQSNCPLIVNTSFNIRGEPIVCSTEEAFNCFMGTDLDVLVVGNCLLVKEEQDKILLTDYRHKHQLD